MGGLPYSVFKRSHRSHFIESESLVLDRRLSYDATESMSGTPGKTRRRRLCPRYSALCMLTPHAGALRTGGSRRCHQRAVSRHATNEPEPVPSLHPSHLFSRLIYLIPVLCLIGTYVLRAGVAVAGDLEGYPNG